MTKKKSKKTLFGQNIDFFEKLQIHILKLPHSKHIFPIRGPQQQNNQHINFFEKAKIPFLDGLAWIIYFKFVLLASNGAACKARACIQMQQAEPGKD